MKKRIITALCTVLTVISLVPTTPVFAYEEGKEPPIWDDDEEYFGEHPEEGKEVIWDDDEPETPSYDTRNKVEMLWDIKHNGICYKVTTVNWWNTKKTTTINTYDVQRVVNSGFEITGYVSRNLYTVAGQNMGAKTIPVFKYVK